MFLCIASASGIIFLHTSVQVRESPRDLNAQAGFLWIQRDSNPQSLDDILGLLRLRRKPEK